MYLYRCKYWYERQLTRYWPLIIILVVCALIVQTATSGTYQYHPSPFSRLIATYLYKHFGNDQSDLGDDIAGVIILLIMISVALALCFGLLASNRRLRRSLARSVKQRPSVVDEVWAPKFIQPALSRFYKGSDKFDAYQTLLNYRLYNGLPSPFTSAKISVIDQSYRREAWRFRRLYHTQAWIQLPITVPNMIIVSKSMDSRQTTSSNILIDQKNFIRLEGNFSDAFDVYVVKGQELNALQILQPDVMERLLRVSSNVWIECSDNTMAIVQFGMPYSGKQLESFEKTCIDTLTVLAPYVTKQQRLRKRTPMEYQIFDGTLRERRLTSDLLLYIVVVLYIVLLAFIGLSYLIKGHTGAVINDTVETCSYLLVIIIALSMISGEIEARLRHALWLHKRRKAVRAHLNTSTLN